MIPNPLGWAWDQVTGLAGEAAGAGIEFILQGLVGWVMDAVIWVVGSVFNFLLDSTDPNVEADWFAAGDGPYPTTAGIASLLLVGFLLVGIVQGVLAGDGAGMLRRMAVDLPASVLGMVALVTVTQALIRLTDELSTVVMANFEDELADFETAVITLSHLSGGYATGFVIFLLALATVLAGLIMMLELAIRGALVYIVVALAPLAFASRLWPAMQGTCRKLLQLLAALILSKLVIAIALAVAAAGAVGTGSGGEVTALPPPEVLAEDEGGSVTQAIGILLASVAAFGVAAFSPLLVAKLLPLTDAATVAQGLRGGPVRAGHQAISTAHSAQWLQSSFRLRHVASGSLGGARSGGTAGTAAKARAGAAAAGPVGIALAATGSTSSKVKFGERASRAVGNQDVGSSEVPPWSQAGSVPNQPTPPAPAMDWDKVPPQPSRRRPTGQPPTGQPRTGGGQRG